MVSYDLEKFIAEHDLMKKKSIWVFGYGSLMWNPFFEYQAKQSARLDGYQRRFCMYSKDYRGTPQKPGLVLGLDDGDYCEGIAFQVANKNIESCLAHLWERESGYTPVYDTVNVSGQLKEVLFFIADKEDSDYYCNKTRSDRIEIVLNTSGAGGTNLEYVINTAKYLEQMNIQDSSILSFVKDIRQKQL